jgi:hypothetical protein
MRYSRRLFATRATAATTRTTGRVAVSCVCTRVIFFIVTQIDVVNGKLSMLVSVVSHTIEESFYGERWCYEGACHYKGQSRYYANNT